jgi:hypothetical protein
MKRFLSALPLLFLAACTSPLGSGGPELQVRTEQEEYVSNPITSVSSVGFTVTNDGDESIYLPRCGEQVTVAIDRRDGGDWRQAYSGICQAIYQATPLELKPGESVRSVVSVGEAGRYRIRVRAAASPESERFDEAVSNAFTVEYSPMG